MALSPEDIEKQLAAAEHSLDTVRQRLARRRLLRFTKATHFKYEASWHHELLATELERLFVGEIDRLIITMPPRHGKSELASRRLPAWALGRNPDEQIIACSYSADLATSMNRDVQRIIMSSDYHDIFPETHLSRSNVVTRADVPALRNSTIFETVGRRGYYLSAGVGGPITGRGMTMGIIDDPFKNRDEANSVTIREKVWNWYTSTFLTRQQENCRIVLIMTRWHEDDLVGRVLRQAKDTGEQWRVLSLPAILDCAACPGDPREMGDALWPARFNLQRLERMQKAITAADWLSLYQQRPTPIGGGMFQRGWWKHAHERERPQRFDHVWQSWDLGFKKTGTSRVCGLVMASAGPKIYVLDRFVEHASYVETRDAIEMMSRRWPSARTKVVEDKANGPAIMNDLADSLGGFIQWPPQGQKMEDKVARASAATPTVRAGDVFLPPAHLPWVADFIEELAAFPAGLYDDQVDAFSQGIAYWQSTPDGLRLLRALTS